MILSILRAQWLSLKFFRHKSAWASLALTLLVWAFNLLIWGSATFLAFVFFSDPGSFDLLPLALPAVLLALMLYWQLSPMLTASLGASIDLQRLLIYPVPRGSLFLVELLLRLMTCPEMPVVLTGVAVGLASNPAIHGGLPVLRVALAALIFAAMNLFLSAGIRGLMERLFARSKWKELLVLAFVLIAVLPQVAVAMKISSSEFRKYLPTGDYLPWGAFSAIVMGRIPGPLMTLSAYTLLAWRFGRKQFEKTLAIDGSQGSRALERHSADEWTMDEHAAGASAKRHRAGNLGTRLDWFYRLPAWLPDPIAAVAEKELRSLARSPQFRLAFAMACSFGFLVWLPFAIRKGDRFQGGIAEHFLVFVCAYGLLLIAQVAIWNCFGYDRTAAQAYFSYPAKISQVLIGKNVAIFAFVVLECAAVLVIAALFRVRVSIFSVSEAMAVTVCTSLFLLAMGNMMSVRLPRPIDPTKMSRQRGSVGMTQFAFVLLFPIALVPVGLAYLAQWAFDSTAAFFGVLAVTFLVGLIVYWIALDSAVKMAAARRELILAELSKGAGPVM